MDARHKEMLERLANIIDGKARVGMRDPRVTQPCSNLSTAKHPFTDMTVASQVMQCRRGIGESLLDTGRMRVASQVMQCVYMRSW